MLIFLLKTLTCAADFIKIDCQSSLPIYASPEKLRCEPETAIDRPGAPGRCASSRHQLAGLKTYAVRYDQQPSLAPSSSSARTPCRSPRSRWQGNSAAAIEEPTQGRRPQSSKDFHRPLQAWIDLTVDLIRLNKPSKGRSTKCKVKKQIRPYADAGFG